MREQTIPSSKPQTGLLPGMLKRTKYTRLRNDSLTSLEDRPPRMLPLKRDLCLASDLAQLDPAMSSHHGSLTLRDFIPRVANIRLQSPISMLGLRRQANTDGDETTDGPTDGPLSTTERGSGPNERISSQPAVNVPSHDDQNLSHSTLCCTKRPITLHRMASFPWTPGCPPCSEMALSCLKKSSALDDAMVGTANREVHHHIKYIGSVEVTQSMRTLDFNTRMRVTREAISRLCERTSAKAALKPKRAVCKGLPAVLGQINLRYSGSRTILTVSTDSMTLIAASSYQKIAHHPMQAISFASGGDSDMEDYIAYVAKDLANQRACHILECHQGGAAEVINSIGRAFETRFRQLLSHTPSFLSTSPRSAVCHKWSQEETMTDQQANSGGEVGEYRDYYNVMPVNTPPPGGMEGLQITNEEKRDTDNSGVHSPRPISLYENCSITDETPAPPAGSVQSEVSAEQMNPLPETIDLIQDEGWFHGRLGRRQAESLLSSNGDFLVRESSSASGQYVLTGMEGATVQHLLLIDPHGQVRTRDQVFLSVGHLVRFHMENHTPIISGSSELHLKQPILQSH